MTARAATSARHVSRVRGAFTVIEVMIVLVIIGIIGGIVTFNLVGAADQARVDSTRQSMETIAGAIKMYHTRHAEFPPDLSYVRNTLNTGGGIPDDAWNQPFDYYLTSDGGFALISNGPDKVAETGDDIFWNPDFE
jgi:general secretion pathway protein G